MRQYLPLAFLAFAAAILGGCASATSSDTPTVQPGDEQPPDLLTGPVAGLLTNFDGFSAHVIETSGSLTDSGKPAAGELIEREGRLIFQPDPPKHNKKDKVPAAGLFFIWQSDQHSGCVLCDALQGCAPLASSSFVTGITRGPRVEDPNPVNGHPCHRVDVVVAMSDGSENHLTEWEADDARQVPVRIHGNSSGRAVNLEFSNVRLELPSPGLFLPPPGFTQYTNSEALLNELMIRSSALRTGPTTGQPADFNSSPPPGPGGVTH